MTSECRLFSCPRTQFPRALLDMVSGKEAGLVNRTASSHFSSPGSYDERHQQVPLLPHINTSGNRDISDYTMLLRTVDFFTKLKDKQDPDQAGKRQCEHLYLCI